MGEIVRYVSRSVIVGLAAGAGVLIIIGQLGRLVGVSVTRPHRLAGVAGEMEKLVHQAGGVNARALLIGAISLESSSASAPLGKLLPGERCWAWWRGGWSSQPGGGRQRTCRWWDSCRVRSRTSLRRG